MRIQFFEHVAFETGAGIIPWAENRGYQCSTTTLYNGSMPPSPQEYDWLIVMGGPMSVTEEHLYPWMSVELKAIETAIKAQVPVLGICLGAQMIAQVLGARVYKNHEREIGFFRVERTPQSDSTCLFGTLPRCFDAFHWHGETFDIPAGAIRTAFSAACANQAFSYAEHVAGLQFHLESTPKSIADLAGNCAEELAQGGRFVQSVQELEKKCTEVVNLSATMNLFLGNFEKHFSRSTELN